MLNVRRGHVTHLVPWSSSDADGSRKALQDGATVGQELGAGICRQALYANHHPVFASGQVLNRQERPVPNPVWQE